MKILIVQFNKYSIPAIIINMPREGTEGIEEYLPISITDFTNEDLKRMVSKTVDCSIK